MLKFIQNVLNIIVPKDRAKMTPPSRDFEVPECDLVKDLKPGDIVLCRFAGPKDFTGGVITHITSSPYSHAEIHIKDGYDISAGSHGVGFIDLLKRNLVKKHNIDIFRVPGGLSRQKRLIIEAKAYQTVLMPYDYFNLVGFPYFKNKEAVAKSGNEAYICSEHVAWCYYNANIDLIKDRPESIEAPADLGRSDQLEYIGTYVEGMKTETNFANEFMGEEWSMLQKLVSKFMGLFTKKDEFYRGLYLNKEKLEGETK